MLNYVLVPKTAAEAVGDPTEQDLKTYYENNKQLFTQPEYRIVALIAVTPKPSGTSWISAKRTSRARTI